MGLVCVCRTRKFTYIMIHDNARVNKNWNIQLKIVKTSMGLWFDCFFLIVDWDLCVLHFHMSVLCTVSISIPTRAISYLEFWNVNIRKICSKIRCVVYTLDCDVTPKFNDYPYLHIFFPFSLFKVSLGF